MTNLPNFTKPQAGDKPQGQPEPTDENKPMPSEPEGTPQEGDLSKVEWLTKELERARKEAAKTRVERNEARAQLDNFKRQELERQGQYQQLYEGAKADLEAKNLEIEASGVYRKAFEDMLHKRIEAIPEAMRGLVPTDYGPIQLAQWLDQNAERLGARRYPNLDAGAGGPSGSGGKKADPRALEIARKLGVDPAKLTTDT